MPKEHQSAVAVGLVLPLAHETKRRRRRAGAADRHAEAVVEHRIRDRLAGIRYAPRAAERIAVVELARRASVLAEAGSVDRRAVLEHRACRSCAVAEIVRGSGAVHLLHPHVIAVVRKRIGRGTRIGDSDHSVFIVIRDGSDARADSDGRAVSVEIVAVAFAARGEQLVVCSIALRRFLLLPALLLPARYLHFPYECLPIFPGMPLCEAFIRGRMNSDAAALMSESG